MSVAFRDATAADVPQIVALLADDPLGTGREGAGMAPYLAAFARMRETPGSQLIVGTDEAGRVVACAQLNILDGLSQQGLRRGQIEAVRVAGPLRSRGVGAALLAECEARARAAGCGLVQLTTHRSRSRAHAFYAREGYEQSHLGFKKRL